MNVSRKKLSWKWWVVIVVGVLVVIGALGDPPEETTAPSTTVAVAGASGSTATTSTADLGDRSPSTTGSKPGGPTTTTTAPRSTGTTGPVPPATSAAVTAPRATTPPTTATPATAPPAGNPRTAEIRHRLDELPVKGRAPKTGYERSLFGPAWTDDVSVPGGHNGCDTRNDILRRDLTVLSTKPGTRDCVILTGTLIDPYTGKSIDFVRGVGTSNAVQIDHVVALSDAWQKGAQQLTTDQRRNLANDPANLLAVDGPTNASKSDGDAATWLPPNKGFRCRYVSLQVNVKARYQLWVTQAEHDAIARVLSSCTDAQIGTLP